MAQKIRRGVRGANAPRYVPGEIAVTYASSASPQLAAARVADFDYHKAGVHTSIVTVDPANTDSELARLRTLQGVRSVARVTYRARMSADNDPYYTGFTGTSAPYYETSGIPGQWDMHAINMDGAWSQFSTAPIAGAPIAVVDTGADVTHPELITPSGITAPKIVRTQCYVTYPTNAAQTTGPYVTDTDGHGTNVAGIADADADNNFAFASVASDAPLLAYRIFPSDPAGGCDVDNPPDQCFTTSADEASAINDAVQHGAKVINLSLGGSPPCTTTDPEYVAVENAIANGVVVVAAAGNGTGNPAVGQPSLDCPAADPGVIAVGASALNDSNPLTLFEYVASYSNYSTNNGTASGGAFLVAPGGDPSASEECGTCTIDHLHWIENIYSVDGVGISQGSTCAGGTDYAGEQNDCNVLIVGTSQATPHVTGVVSLMLAKNPNLTPAQIATGLCASADNIGDAKQGCGRVNASAAVTWAATH
jgi:subtilisin family serine protease